MIRQTPVSPFTADEARRKVRAAENAWNQRDPATVIRAYSPDSRWRLFHVIRQA